MAVAARHGQAALSMLLLWGVAAACAAVGGAEQHAPDTDRGHPLPSPVARGSAAAEPPLRVLLAIGGAHARDGARCECDCVSEPRRAAAPAALCADGACCPSASLLDDVSGFARALLAQGATARVLGCLPEVEVGTDGAGVRWVAHAAADDVAGLAAERADVLIELGPVGAARLPRAPPPRGAGSGAEPLLSARWDRAAGLLRWARSGGGEPSGEIALHSSALAPYEELADRAQHNGSARACTARGARARAKHAYCFSQPPAAGLSALLARAWPAVLARHPGARLHVLSAHAADLSAPALPSTPAGPPPARPLEPPPSGALFHGRLRGARLQAALRRCAFELLPPSGADAAELELGAVGRALANGAIPISARPPHAGWRNVSGRWDLGPPPARHAASAAAMAASLGGGAADAAAAAARADDDGLWDAWLAAVVAAPARKLAQHRRDMRRWACTHLRAADAAQVLVAAGQQLRRDDAAATSTAGAASDAAADAAECAVPAALPADGTASELASAGPAAAPGIGLATAPAEQPPEPPSEPAHELSLGGSGGWAREQPQPFAVEPLYSAEDSASLPPFDEGLEPGRAGAAGPARLSIIALLEPPAGARAGAYGPLLRSVALQSDGRSELLLVDPRADERRAAALELAAELGVRVRGVLGVPRAAGPAAALRAALNLACCPVLSIIVASAPSVVWLPRGFVAHTLAHFEREGARTGAAALAYEHWHLTIPRKELNKSAGAHDLDALAPPLTRAPSRTGWRVVRRCAVLDTEPSEAAERAATPAPQPAEPAAAATDPCSSPPALVLSARGVLSPTEEDAQLAEGLAGLRDQASAGALPHPSVLLDARAASHVVEIGFVAMDDDASQPAAGVPDVAEDARDDDEDAYGTVVAATSSE